MSLQNLAPFKTLLQLPMEDLQRRINDPNEVIPGHLLLSAMKAKSAMQAGAQQPVPPTVKEQVTSGIGAMMPQPTRSFFGGGSINLTPEDLNRMIWERIRWPFAAVAEDWDKVKNKSRNKIIEQRYPATIPTEPTGPYRPEGHQYPAVNAGNPTAELPQTLPASQRSGAAGVAAVGPNPIAKYKEFPKYDVTARDLNSISVPEIPVNAALPESIQDIIAQRAKAQQQAQANARTAGLTAFGEAMLAPGRRGFGAAFPGAANKWVGTHQGIMSEADKEDARLRAEQRATNMAMGAEKVANEGKMYDRRLAERGFEVGQAEKKWGAEVKLAELHNDLKFKLEDLSIKRQSVAAQMQQAKEIALSRKEERLFRRLTELDVEGQKAAQAAVNSVNAEYEKHPLINIPGPESEKLKLERARKAADAETRALERVQKNMAPIYQQLGMTPPEVGGAPVGINVLGTKKN